MSDFYPIAFHITFGTYGTRLHGDERGTVERSMNHFGEPIIGRFDQWEHVERAMLKFDPRVWSAEQMILIERLVPKVCERGGWSLHACAAGPDHVHNILTPMDSTRGDGKAIRKWLKRWLGEELRTHVLLQEDETYWAECGSVKWIWTEDYFQRAVDYVKKQRATERGCEVG